MFARFWCEFAVFAVYSSLAGLVCSSTTATTTTSSITIFTFVTTATTGTDIVCSCVAVVFSACSSSVKLTCSSLALKMEPSGIGMLIRLNSSPLCRWVWSPLFTCLLKYLGCIVCLWVCVCVSCAFIMWLILWATLCVILICLCLFDTDLCLKMKKRIKPQLAFFWQSNWCLIFLQFECQM